ISDFIFLSLSILSLSFFTACDAEIFRNSFLSSVMRCNQSNINFSIPFTVTWLPGQLNDGTAEDIDRVNINYLVDGT
ncbi:MAG: hypothetical protein HN654_04110, partial [Candidatus Marinimicrobia bacterium]|nr:hypothetical protein [Candidatus Neomarinimicrobiota bacterium]MBT7519530.1 hypothetical protein [Candidatus Neomarinimicrobiota bacterium]